MKLSRVEASAEVSCLAVDVAIVHKVQGELLKGELVYAFGVDLKVELDQEFFPKRSSAKIQKGK